MQHFDRITRDVKIQNGQPCLAGTRLTVRRVVSIVAEYPDRDELLREFPELDDDGIRQCLYFAAAMIADEEVELDVLAAAGA